MQAIQAIPNKCLFPREFYTGWLTHWGEKNAETDANYTAAALEKILSRNGSVVLYVWFLPFPPKSREIVLHYSIALT